MNSFFSGVLLFLLLNLLIGLVRVYRGRTAADKLLAAQLIGTTGTAMLLVMYAKQDEPGLIDAALIIAVLSSVTLMAFSGRFWRREEQAQEGGSRDA